MLQARHDQSREESQLISSGFTDAKEEEEEHNKQSVQSDRTVVFPPPLEVRKHEGGVVVLYLHASPASRSLRRDELLHLERVPVEEGRRRAGDALLPQLVSDALRPQPSDGVEVDQKQAADADRPQ